MNRQFGAIRANSTALQSNCSLAVTRICLDADGGIDSAMIDCFLEMWRTGDLWVWFNLGWIIAHEGRTHCCRGEFDDARRPSATCGWVCVLGHTLTTLARDFNFPRPGYLLQIISSFCHSAKKRGVNWARAWAKKGIRSLSVAPKIVYFSFPDDKFALGLGANWKTGKKSTALNLWSTDAETSDHWFLLTHSRRGSNLQKSRQLKNRSKEELTRKERVCFENNEDTN